MYHGLFMQTNRNIFYTNFHNETIAEKTCNTRQTKNTDNRRGKMTVKTDDALRKGQKVFFQDISGRPVRAIIDAVFGNPTVTWCKVHISAITDPRWRYGDAFTTSVNWLAPRSR
jgi:hypothetical protein